MIRNYLKIAWRNLLNNKSFSATNVLGLAMGIGCTIFILLWVADERSYDRFQENYKTTFKVMCHRNFNGEINTDDAVIFPLAQALENNYPQVKNAVVTSVGNQVVISRDETKLVRRGLTVSEHYFDIFSWKFQKGNASALLDPSAIILTASTARALFGDRDPVNEMVTIDNGRQAKVAAVLGDVPANSTIRFDFIVPFNHSDDFVKRSMNDWTNSFSYVFVQASATGREKEISQLINAVVKQHNPSGKGEYFVHPMNKWRLYSDFKNGQNTGGTIEYVRLFSLIAVIVLLIACVNFMNLSTARSAKRAKEVGIRKTLGSEKKHLIIQFFLESSIIALAAFIVALLATTLLMPSFNQLVNKELELPMDKPVAWAIALAIVLFTGLVAGSYPALYLSSFHPLKVLKGPFRQGGDILLPRKLLVILQFAVSIILISGTIIIYRQLQFVKNRDLGYDPSNLIMIRSTKDADKNFDVIRQDLLQPGLAASVTRTSSPITEVWNWTPGPDWPGKPQNASFIVTAMGAEEGFTSTMGIKMREGRDFTSSPADTSMLLLNEAAVKTMGLKNPVGMQLRYGGREYTLNGITENVVMTSPYTTVEPMMILPRSKNPGFIHIRLAKEARPQKALSAIESIFKKYNPAAPFEYRFADEEFGRKFQAEELIGKLTNLFAGLAIFICCLGLAGLAAYTIQKRVKEIGIRKVLGASVQQLLLLISKEFLILVLMAFLLALPVAWWCMNEWLKNYQYRIDVSFWLLGIAGLVVLMLAMVIVFVKTIHAAVANPVKALRAE